MADSNIRRNRRVSMRQLDILWEFLNSHRDIAKAFNRSLQAKEYSARTWREIAEVLNAQGDGVHKDGKMWCKYWVDFKGKLKKRNAAIHSSRRQTGGGPSVELPLSDIEEKFLHIMGEDFGKGLAGIRVDPFPEATTSRTPTVETGLTPVSESILMRETPEMELEFLEAPQEMEEVSTHQARFGDVITELAEGPAELVEGPAELVEGPAEPQRAAVSPEPSRRRRSRRRVITREEARHELVQTAQVKTAAAVRSSAAMEGIQQSLTSIANTIAALQNNVNDIKSVIYRLVQSR